MTEEDTFKALKKPDLCQMFQKWNDFVFPIDAKNILDETWPDVRETFFEGYQWTWDEFYEARKDYLKRCEN